MKIQERNKNSLNQLFLFVFYFKIISSYKLYVIYLIVKRLKWSIYASVTQQIIILRFIVIRNKFIAKISLFFYQYHEKLTNRGICLERGKDPTICPN